MKLTVVFVHGWSVTNLDTYGGLPLRMREEGTARGLDLEVEEIFLGRYISFHDEVKVEDISRAFRMAVKEQLTAGTRFVCITHSTGGPVMRDWWSRYYKNNTTEICPLSHLIMLAPANFGSALAQLGKGKISRMKSWFEGVQPGQGVLNWLELGSAESWELNREWIFSDGTQLTEQGMFPFVITGQDIDRRFYDNLNSYTGELGSDGVVRAAAANLNARYMELSQPAGSDSLVVSAYHKSPHAPFRIVNRKSHSGDKMGILKSVGQHAGDDKSKETLTAIFDCIAVKTKADYETLANAFDAQTVQTQAEGFIEIEKKLLSRRVFIHDRYSMIIFRVRDDHGYRITDFDLLLTGQDSDPNRLPEGFFGDRQRNTLNPDTITYYFNYDIMNGSPEVKDPETGETVRKAIVGTDVLGLEIRPRPDGGFVRYRPCKIEASKEFSDRVLSPNGTTLIDIRLQRIVSTETMRLVPVTTQQLPTGKAGDFSKTKPGTQVAE
jgi:hypothetical protein